MAFTCLLCGDPQQPSEYMYEAMHHLEDEGVVFEQIDWAADHSPTEFRDLTMDMESAGPGAFDNSDIAANLGDADALVVHKAPVSADLLDGTDLEVVGCARGGTENVDVTAANERDVTVLHAPGRNRNAVADYAATMLLSRLRGVPFHHQDMAAGEWNQVFDPDRLPRDVAALTIGVVGFGNIGQEVTKRLQGFGADVAVHDPYVEDSTIEAAEAEPASLHDLLERSDAVTLHVRLSAETDGLIGESEFAAMKDSAFLVNTARGGLVDEAALVEALQSDEISGAALDVFREEPLPAGHPLFDCDGVVMSPHVAGSTRDAVTNGPKIIGRGLKAYLDGDEPEHIVD